MLVHAGKALGTSPAAEGARPLRGSCTAGPVADRREHTWPAVLLVRCPSAGRRIGLRERGPGNGVK